MINFTQISLLDDRAWALNQTAIVVNKVQSFDGELRQTRRNVLARFIGLIVRAIPINYFG